MPVLSAVIEQFDVLSSSWLILGIFAAVAALAGSLYCSGLLGAILRIVGAVITRGTRLGFRVWQLLFAWAAWPAFLALAFGSIAVGIWLLDDYPLATALIALLPLSMGITACFAYMVIDQERYEVGRGYKSIHNPVKGQEVAHHLLRYGHRVGQALMAAAAASAIGGFALLNEGLCHSFGREWYSTEHVGTGFPDFLAYALINLYGIVDVLDSAASRHLLRIPHIRSAATPANLLMLAFRSYFTFVLIQQLVAAVRAGWLLGETIDDFWSPHETIHLRARSALPLHGLSAIQPLLSSLRSRLTLTKEQHEQLPVILAEIGPALVPILAAHLNDPHEHVRAVAVAALGRLRAVEVVPRLVLLGDDPSALVRQSLAETLGGIGDAKSDKPQLSRFVTVSIRSGRTSWMRFWRWRECPQTVSDPTPLIVACLRARLSDSSPGVRVQAATALGRIGSASGAAVPELRSLIKSGDETVRCRATEALGHIRAADAASLDCLVELLADASALVRQSAARALGSLQEAAAPAVPVLLKALHDADPEVRQASANAVQRIGTVPAEAIDSLIAGLESPDSVLRADTARALGTIGTVVAEAAPALVEALEDDSDAVRAQAVEALGRMGPAAAETAVPRVIRALRDPDNWVSALAAEALGELRPAGEDTVRALRRSLRHVNVRVRSNAAEALGKLGTAAAAAQADLAAAARDPEGTVRAEAVRALGALGLSFEEIGGMLSSALGDPDPQVRAAAAEAAGRCEHASERFQAELVHLLSDASDMVKEQAARVIPRLVRPAPTVIDGLCRRLRQEDNPVVQAQVAQALAQMGPAARAAGADLAHAALVAEASVRAQALRALVCIQPPEAPDVFQAALKDSNAEIRIIASAGWRRAAEISDAAVPVLVEALRDPETAVRINAAYALARLEPLPGEAVPLLLDNATHESDALRLHAALALQAARAPAVAEAMRYLLEDPSPRVRLVAARFHLAVDPVHGDALNVVALGLSAPTFSCRKAALELIDSLRQAPPVVMEALKQRVAVEQDAVLQQQMQSLLSHRGNQPPRSFAVPTLESTANPCPPSSSASSA